MEPQEKELVDEKSLLKRDPNTRFFCWLYYPKTFLSLDDILKKEAVNLPDDFLVYKIIQNLKINGESLDEIIHFLISNGLIDESDIEKVISIHEQMVLPKRVLSADKISLVEKVINLCQIMITARLQTVQKNVPHDGYPENHPDHGRPRIGWCECYHQQCHQKFRAGFALVDHLKQEGKYTHSFHLQHEKAVELMHLTPETVKAQGMTRCPSTICDQSDREFTPKELCQHFGKLGIPPFWPAVADDSEEEGESEEEVLEAKTYTKLKISDDALKDLFGADDCLICCDSGPEAILQPCNHYVFCLSCLARVKDLSQCPLCSQRVQKVIPF